MPAGAACLAGAAAAAPPGCFVVDNILAREHVLHRRSCALGLCCFSAKLVFGSDCWHAVQRIVSDSSSCCCCPPSFLSRAQDLHIRFCALGLCWCLGKPLLENDQIDHCALRPRMAGGSIVSFYQKYLILYFYSYAIHL